MGSTTPLHRHIWIAQYWWVNEIYEGIAEYAAGKNWRLDTMMQWHRGDIVKAPENVDGVIVFTGDSPTLVNVIKGLSAPVVDIETYIDHYSAPKVVTSDYDAGMAAAIHLSASQPRALVFVVVPQKINEVIANRRLGFFTGAGATGLPVIQVSQENFDPVALAAEGPVGVFTGSDSWTINLEMRALDAGVRVPEDMAFVGVDDDPIRCTLAPVPLSSVNMNFKMKGRVAAETLEKLMNGGSVPRRTTVPVKGVTCRESTMLAKTDHSDLDRLIRYFRENARRPVGVITLCEECGIPTRTALHLLRTRTGKSLHTLLRECRLVLAERFAASGTLTRHALAKASGFPSYSAYLRAKEAKEAGGEPEMTE